ncbi:helix-turn-helix domain-containing protein [Streptomyces sp. NPDC057494]|uniref:helix-turn-helix domain-containing protein n=1 Tax=Streptomyces sp. NPDC057494 TaxID=3346148 RepID=UPI0036BA71E2
MAKELRVSVRSVQRWRQAWKAAGPDGVRSPSLMVQAAGQRAMKIGHIDGPGLVAHPGLADAHLEFLTEHDRSARRFTPRRHLQRPQDFSTNPQNPGQPTPGPARPVLTPLQHPSSASLGYRNHPPPQRQPSLGIRVLVAGLPQSDLGLRAVWSSHLGVLQSGRVFHVCAGALICCAGAMVRL